MSTQNTDLPPELGSYSDGLTDDAAYQPEIIGACSCPSAVGAHHGIPGYLLTRKGLHDRTVRARIAEHIRAMTPKLRRRVLNRLRQAVLATRRVGVSGAVRGAYPTVGWQNVPGVRSVSVGRCPYAKVAGPFTP